MEFFGLKSASHSSDGHLVSFTFETDKGDLDMVANTAAMEMIIQIMASALFDAKGVSSPNDLYSVVQPQRFQVRTLKNRQGVMLHFLMSGKLAHRYALSNEDAKNFRFELDEAVAGRR